MKINYVCSYCGEIIPVENNSYDYKKKCAKSSYGYHGFGIFADGNNVSDEQANFITEVNEMPNQTLYDEYINLVPGDDYDGCMTNEGEYRLLILKQELENRLSGWLSFDGVSNALN